MTDKRAEIIPKKPYNSFHISEQERVLQYKTDTGHTVTVVKDKNNKTIAVNYNG